jgi:hypothetical protein
MKEQVHYLYVLCIKGKDKKYVWIKKTTKTPEEMSSTRHCNQLLRYLNDMGRSNHKKKNDRVDEYLKEFPVTSEGMIYVEQCTKYPSDVEALEMAVTLSKLIDEVEGQLCLTTIFR